MDLVFKKNRCCGCMLCVNICPVKAIQIAEDEEGFKYPKINKEICIDCEACKKVCCFNNEEKLEKSNVKVYAAKNKNDEIRKKSTSGGVFSSIASNVIESGGTVYGAILNEKLHIEHVRADTKNQLEKFYGSKYVQSDIFQVYNLILNDLKEKKLVLFSGTPCQVAALKKFVKKSNCESQNLITCDFVCHGVPTIKIFKNHIKFIENKFNKEVIGYKFRSKDYGWKGHYEKAIFKDGTDTSSYNDKYMNIYKELYGSLNIIRPSCYECPYAKEQRISDITIGDFWGIENYDKDFYDNKGISLLMINSEVGEAIFSKIKDDFKYKEEDINICRNPQLRKPTYKPGTREKFWKEYYNKGYKYIAKKYTTYGLIKNIRVKTYKVLKKCNIIKEK